jgi:hypothetical protein
MSIHSSALDSMECLARFATTSCVWMTWPHSVGLEAGAGKEEEEGNMRVVRCFIQYGRVAICAAPRAVVWYIHEPTHLFGSAHVVKIDCVQMHSYRKGDWGRITAYSGCMREGSRLRHVPWFFPRDHAVASQATCCFTRRKSRAEGKRHIDRNSSSVLNAWNLFPAKPDKACNLQGYGRQAALSNTPFAPTISRRSDDIALSTLLHNAPKRQTHEPYV